ncbi:MAG: DnaJ domain-containing protein [Clostridiales bacterium]|nr:DnaJ domain-containing protein [Clostridiales bacterium]
MKNKRDYYDVLGVKRDVSEDGLKAAYRKMGKKYHPDTHPDDADADAKMQEINEAYAVLSDVQKRADYDRNGSLPPEHGSARKGSGPFSGGFGGFDGFGGSGSTEINFENFFSGAFGGFSSGAAGGKAKGEPKRGRDVSASVDIGYGEAISGTKKEVSFSFAETCGSCNGTGSLAEEAETCKRCNGTGQERVTTQSAFGKMTKISECPACGGKGKFKAAPCQRCAGSGFVNLNKKILVTIPKGIRSGQAVSVKGMGEPGKQGGPRGNLLVKVFVH